MGYYPVNPSTSLTNPMTAAGDMIDGGASGTPTRLAIGTSNEVLTVISGAPSWQPATSGFTNPMTTAGDMIDATTGGTAQRLAIGTAGQGLLVQSGAPAWANTVNSVAAADTSIVVAGTALAPTLATGTLDVIAADHPPAANWSNNSHKITSVAAGSAGTDVPQFAQTLAGGDGAPMTTAGDLLIMSATPAPTRLAVGATAGAAGSFLGVASGLPAWGYPSGQLLATPNAYSPGTQTLLTAATTTMAAFLSASVNTGSFTAPASGTVLVTVSFVFGVSNASCFCAFGLANHGTTTMQGNCIEFEVSTTGAQYFIVLQFLITGLTAGSSFNFDLMGCCTSTDTVTIYAFAQGATTTPVLGATGRGSPVLMMVQAV